MNPEEHRELVVGLDYDEYCERVLAEVEEEAYDIRDPKHPDHYERLIDLAERDDT